MQKIRIVVILAFIILSSAWVGFVMGRKNSETPATAFNPKQSITGTTPPKNRQVDFSMFWDVWDRLASGYIDKQKLDPQKMVYGAIAGMVSSLEDPYTVFLPPKENKDAKDELGGQFEGIGAQLGVKDKRIVVIAPLKGTPAEKAGIRAGDWILKVDGKETADWTLPQTVSKIRGPKGSQVVLTILHEKEQKPVEISVRREAIHVSSVEWDKVNVRCTNAPKALEPSGSPKSACEVVKESCKDCQTIAHLRLSRFGDKTTEEWQKAITEIEAAFAQKELRGIVFDLRNNPGGYLQGSVFIASEFLSDGTIVTQHNADGSKQTYEVNRKGAAIDTPLVVLVNKGSASASEIVAGALKVRNRAKLIGQTTFGKGSVQDTQDLPGGAGLHITVAKWLLPDGTWINGAGVDPDYKIERDENNPEIDVQLEKAAEVLLSIK